LAQTAIFLPKGDGLESYNSPGSVKLVAPYLCLDAKEHPHTVFWQNLPDSNQEAIIHAWHDGSAWHTEEIARRKISDNFQPGLHWCIDNSDTLHLLLSVGVDAYHQDLEYAKRNQDGTWAFEHINMPPQEQNFIGEFFKMFVDESGVPHVMVDALNALSCHVVRTGPGNWTWENLEGCRFPEHHSSDGFGQGPSDFSLIMVGYINGAEQFCLLTKAAGVWQPAVPIAPYSDNRPFKWARSRTGDRMAFNFYDLEKGTKVVVWSEGIWSTHILDGETCPSFLAFDPANRLQLMVERDPTVVTTWNVFYEKMR